MTSADLFFGPTPAGKEAVHPFVAACARRPFDRLRVAAAFATESGVAALERLVEAGWFEAARKQWLIGLENGFTQPEALRRLAALPRSEVCLVEVDHVLAAPGLAGATFFHPKLYEFASVAEGATTIVTTSANLTQGGLRDNVEQFLSWDGSLSDDVAVTLDRWWRRLWRREWRATPALIDEYAARRPAVQPRGGGGGGGGSRGPIVEVEPAPSELRAARELWVEAVRPLEGGSRNQLELILNAHVFFFPEAVDERRRLWFVDEAGLEFANPKREVVFHPNNAMWRVHLPTAREGMEGYQGGGVLVRFRRTDVPDRYLVSFVPAGSAEARAWYAASTKVAGVPGPPPRSMGWTV